MRRRLARGSGTRIGGCRSGQLIAVWAAAGNLTARRAKYAAEGAEHERRSLSPSQMSSGAQTQEIDANLATGREVAAAGRVTPEIQKRLPRLLRSSRRSGRRSSWRLSRSARFRAASRRCSMRSLGDRCFAPTWSAARPFRAARFPGRRVIGWCWWIRPGLRGARRIAGGGICCCCEECGPRVVCRGRAAEVV